MDWDIVVLWNDGTTPAVPLDFQLETGSLEVRPESQDSFPDEAG